MILFIVYEKEVIAEIKNVSIMPDKGDIIETPKGTMIVIKKWFSIENKYSKICNGFEMIGKVQVIKKI